MRHSFAVVAASVLLGPVSVLETHVSHAQGVPVPLLTLTALAVAADASAAANSAPATAAEPAVAANAATLFSQDLSTAAVFLHAEALEAELDHEYPRALRLLRQARKSDPTNPDVIYDLARIAALFGGDDSDLQGYRESADVTALPELRAAIDARLGMAQDEQRKWLDGALQAYVRAGATVDTNVALAPSLATPFEGGKSGPDATAAPTTRPLTGARLVLSGQVSYTPIVGPMQVDVAGYFDIGRFVSEERGDSTGGPADLSQYNANVLAASARFVLNKGPLLLTVTGGASNIFDGTGDTYLTSFELGTVALLGGDLGHIGFFADVGHRAFGGVDNLEGTPDDRTGPSFAGGIAWDLSVSKEFGLRGRAGVAVDRTRGPAMRTAGSLISIVGLLNFDRVHAACGVYNEAMLFGVDRVTDWQSAAALRIDDRVNPFLRVSVDIIAHLGVYGAYSYIQNFSNHDKNQLARGEFEERNRTYTRNFVELGVEGRL